MLKWSRGEYLENCLQLWFVSGHDLQSCRTQEQEIGFIEYCLNNVRKQNIYHGGTEARRETENGLLRDSVSPW